MPKSNHFFRTEMAIITFAFHSNKTLKLANKPVHSI